MSIARPPQQDRSRATRQSLLDATIESLADVGWSGTTVVAVAARAGVSRGAAQHHFATRDDLVLASVDQVTDEISEQLAASRIDATTENRAQAVVELLADVWTSSVGRAATHLWVAASTDPELRDLVLPLERRLNREIYQATFALLGADADEQRAREAVRLTLHLVRGVGLGSLLRADRARIRADLSHWAVVLAAAVGGGMPL